MRRLLSSVEYNDTPTRANHDKQLEAMLSPQRRNTKPTAIATARLADESGRRTPGGRPTARDPLGRRRCSPHLCHTHARDKPLTHQTKHPTTVRKPHPPHICGCGAQYQPKQTNTQQTTNKHTTIANTRRHAPRSPTLTQPAKPRRIPRRDQRGRNTQTATKKPNTHHSAKHAKPPRTCTHDRHKPKRTSPLPLPPRHTPKRAPSTGEAHASKHVRGAPKAHARNHAPPRKRREIP